MQTELRLTSCQHDLWQGYPKVRGHRKNVKVPLRYQVLNEESHATHFLAGSLTHMFVFLGFGF